MKVYYNSQLQKCKTPFGAVSTGREVQFSIYVAAERPLQGVSICIRQGDRTENVPMNHVGADIWSVKKTFFTPAIYNYRFEVYDADGLTNFVGMGENGEAKLQDWLPEWQLTVYDKAYVSPASMRGGVIYHVFCDRFCRDDGVASDRPLSPWGSVPRVRDTGGIYRGEEFFGGNLRGIASKMDYLRDLGVTVLYLSPIFKARSNHRYDTGDYFQIDPLLGTEQDFSALCSAAHDRGIKVVLDGVFNHTGSDSKYFNKFGTYPNAGAWQGKDSPYYDWFTFGDYPSGYRAWWGIDNVPTVNKDNADYQQMIYGEGGVIEKWLRLGADGWRLDVADELPTFFIEGIRDRLRQVKPEGYLLGEVWEDASIKYSYGTYRPYLLGKQLDGVMNYPFGTAILDAVKGGDVDRFVRDVNTIIENYPEPMLAHSMTIIDTHDTSRAINVLSGVAQPETLDLQRERTLTTKEYALGKNRLMLASAIQYFLPGMPSVFYGDEAGATGFHDPLSRPCYPWGAEDRELMAHYTALGRLRAKFRQQFGADCILNSSDGILRIKRGSDNPVTLMVNLSNENVQIAGFDLISEKEFNQISPGKFVVIS